MTDNKTDEADLVERYLQATLLIVICLIALIGNISLWIVILTNKRLYVPANALILCLSAADVLVSAVNMPVIICTLIVGEWLLEEIACSLLGFSTMLTFVASVLSLGVISINRYIHVCHHANYKTLFTANKTALFILGTWLLSVVLAMPPLVGWGKYDYLDKQFFCFCDWKTSISYTLFMVGICFGGPCSVMTFCYVNILRTFRESKRRVTQASEGRASVGDDRKSGHKLQFREQVSGEDTSISLMNQSIAPVAEKTSLHSVSATVEVLEAGRGESGRHEADIKADQVEAGLQRAILDPLRPCQRDIP